MASWCSTVWTPYECEHPRRDDLDVPGHRRRRASAPLSPLLQAVVTFDDYPHGSVSAPASSLPTFQCQVYCGTSMVTNSWVWSPDGPHGHRR